MITTTGVSSSVMKAVGGCQDFGYVLVLLTLLATAADGQTGDTGQEVSKLLVFRDLPSGMDIGHPQHLIIRSSYEGSIEFFDSNQLRIEVNVTSPSLQDLARVGYNFTDYHNSLLLQLLDVEPLAEVGLIIYVSVLIGSVFTLTFLGSLLFVCWWSACRKPLLESDKVSCPDASQAPLLENHPPVTGNQTQPMPNKSKKCCPTPLQQIPTDESCISSEDDLNEDRTQTKRGGIPSRAAQKKDRLFETEVVTRALSESSPQKTNAGGYVDRTLTTKKNIDPAADKAVRAVNVSCIHMDSGSSDSHDGSCSRKGGQYIQLASSDKRYSQEGELDKTGSLRLRREGSANSDMIPDVVRTRSGKGPSYAVPECPSQAQYIALKSTDGEFSDSEYSTINRAISGARVVQILSDGCEKMPRYETVERPKVKFSPDTKKPLESPVVFDTFGKPRVVEGNEPHYATVALGGARSKDASGHRSRKYVMQPHRDHGSGHLSPASSGTDHSSDSGRLVDEAYGTLGSNGGSSTVSGGTASTGSGSSGSVVTVIAADDPGSALLSRRHVFPKQQGECQLRDQSPKRATGGTLPMTRKDDGSNTSYGNSGVAPKYLQMSVLCCVTVACLMTGIYAMNERSTKVHIKVFVPPNFLRYKPEVFTVKGKSVNVTSSLKQDKFEVDTYEVDDPCIADLGVDPCRTMHCAQSCDAMTGSCICRRGYRLVDGNKCEDINECRQGEPVCHDHAHCVNTDGKFTCECSKGYYSSGLQCQACAAPCPNGTFEVMPCSDTHPKLCRDCSNSCMDGYFISAPCGSTYNTACKPCRSRCTQSEYEFTPCLRTLERQCRDIASLTKPIVSNNIIFEDRRDIKQAISPVQPQDIRDGPLTHTFVLPRGSDLTVHASILEANLAPLFRAVNHSDSNDNEGFFEDIRITQEYCPYPIPEKYQLNVFVHKGITTKAKNVSCGRRKRSLSSPCDGESGYYLNPRERCETYSKFGIMPQLNPEGWSVLCVKPGKLSDVFEVSSDLREVTTLFYDVNERCAGARSECDLCILNCSYTMKNHRGGHRCNITADDSDNGESPRLQYCFSCCNKQECSKVCEVYHNKECPQLRCLTGNVAEFVLSPSFSHRNSIFTCHIEPVPGYRIYDIEYYVKYKGKKVNDRTLKAQRIYDKSGHPKRAVDIHNFLKIYYGSEVETKPDLIEGDSMLKSFSAGYYQTKGQELTNLDNKLRTFNVRPKVPFAVSSKTWRKESCDTDVLSNFVIASNTPPGSDPFRPDPLVDVMYVSRGTYRLFNKTQGHLPSIYLEIPKDKSVLRSLYDATTVRDDTTLKAELIRHDDEWILHVSGELLKCPGAFNVIVRDPGYPGHSIFDFDVGAGCPNSFTVDFIIPTEGNDTYNKTYLVDIVDTYRTIKMTVFRPVPNMSREAYEFFHANASHDAPVNYNKGRETSLSIFTPPVVVLCVVISVLAILLFFGFVTESVEKLNLKSEGQVDSQHLFFVVCYITFRATYSVAVTFTILVLLIRHFNRDSVTTLQQFSQFAETASNSQRLDVERIQSYVMEELQRQNGLANNTKQLCEHKLIQLQNQLEDAKQQMRVDSQEDRLVSQVALQYTKVLILNLTNNVNKFKHEFSVYAKKALDRLTRSIVQTSSAIQSSKWLAGAKEIYEAVRTKRSAQGLDTKPFMEWAGIEQEVDRLVADLSIKDFPMPNLTEFINVEVPKMSNRQVPIPKASDIVLPRNQWFYHYEKKSVANDGDRSSIQPAKDLKVNTSDIISLSSFLAILVAIDLIWFIHRMARTYSTAKMILYGCPVYISCKKLSADESQRLETGKLSSSPIVNCLHFLRDLNLRVMKTEFVPKLVATVTVCCALYVMLAASDRLVTIKTLGSIGYFDALVAPVETSYRLAKTRVKMNAHRINKFEFPFYEEMINVRTKRYQLLLEMYAEVQHSNFILHDSEYCMWKKMLKPDEPCNCTTVTVGRLHFDGCELPPVMPQAYHRKDFGLHREQLSNSMVPYISAARNVVMNTCHLVAIFVAVLVSVDAFGSVIWIYLKRFNLLRMKPLFEIEQYPAPEEKCQT